MVDAAKAGEGQHGNSRGQVEAARHVGGAECDLDQILGRGFDVDAGIGQEENFSFSRDYRAAAQTRCKPSRMRTICSAGRMVSGQC
jgi:hypothetical protein